MAGHLLVNMPNKLQVSEYVKRIEKRNSNLHVPYICLRRTSDTSGIFQLINGFFRIFIKSSASEPTYLRAKLDRY